MLQKQVIHSLPEIMEKLRVDLQIHRKELFELGPSTPKTQHEKDKLLLKEIDSFLNAMVGASTIYNMYAFAVVETHSTLRKVEMAQKVYNAIYEECGKFLRDMKRPAPLASSRRSESTLAFSVAFTL